MVKNQGAQGGHQIHGKRPRVAAVDLGSNTCRLIICEVLEGGGLENLEIFSRTVRLGEDLSHSGKLSVDAMDRAVSVLKICALKIKKYAPERLRCVATEACRQASNVESFKSLVAKVTGLSLEVISAEEEARLCLKGCASLLNASIPYALIFDIGGGSSELIWVKIEPFGEPEILDFISLPFGVVALSETYGAYTGVVFEDIVLSIKDRLKSLKSFQNIQNAITKDAVQMIGCSGTATTLAALKLELPTYDRTVIDNTILERVDIEKIKKILCRMTPQERLVHPCIGPGRSDLVVPGLSIFAGIYDTFPVSQMWVADRGVRDGLVFSLAEDLTPQDSRVSSPTPRADLLSVSSCASSSDPSSAPLCEPSRAPSSHGSLAQKQGASSVTSQEIHEKQGCL